MLKECCLNPETPFAPVPHQRLNQSLEGIRFVSYTCPEYMAGWCVRSGTVTPVESREYLDDAASFVVLLLLLLLIMGPEILRGKRENRLVARFMAGCGE